MNNVHMEQWQRQQQALRAKVIEVDDVDWVLPPLLAPDISGNSSALATTAKPAAIKPKPRAPASPTDLGGQLPEGHVNVEGIGAASVAGAKPVLRLVGGLDISFVPATPDPAAGHMGDAAAAGPCSPPSGTSGQQGSTGGSTGGCDGSAGGASCVVEEQEEGGGGSERAVAALVVLTFPELRVVYEDCEEVRLDTPYVPGFLGFREVPAYQALLSRCAAAHGGRFMPQVVLVDGCGVLHPARCGSASHLGAVSGLTTVGVAKNLLVVDGLDRGHIEAAAAGLITSPPPAQLPGQLTSAACATAPDPSAPQPQPQVVDDRRPVAAADSQAQLTFHPQVDAGEDKAGSGVGHGGGELRGLQAGDSASWPHGASCLAREVDAAAGEGGRRALPLVGASGAVWGAAMCGPTSRKPVYVSVGHRLGLATALELVARCCVSRVPEPVRQADLRSREAVRRLVAGRSGVCGLRA